MNSRMMSGIQNSMIREERCEPARDAIQEGCASHTAKSRGMEVPMPVDNEIGSRVMAAMEQQAAQAPQRSFVATPADAALGMVVAS